MKTLRVIYRYLQDDPNCNSDCEGFLIVVDGKPLSYADHPQLSFWEDRYPRQQIRAFIDGVRMANPRCHITEENKADLEC